MHTLDANSSNVPAFLIKLWKLVEDPSCDDLIAWSDAGYSFLIKDQTKFAKDLLPQYFKHNNMASFVRQLNMYGFKKVMNIEKSGLKTDNNEMEFQHGCFVKERADLLELIKRKISNPKIVEAPVAKSNAKDILIDLSSIREKQENMDSMLLKMKSENELLWRELTGLRQKHKAQEQIIQKVIQFLVSIVQRNNPNIGVQRKITRMLHNSPGSKGNSSQVSRTIDLLRKQNPECIIVPEKSPQGPVIHEVLDTEQDDNPSSSLSQNISVASPCVKSPDSVKDNSDDAAPKYNLVSLLNNSSSCGVIEPGAILEAFTPMARNNDAENVIEESILGIPLDYITVADNTEASNVISIPDTAEGNEVSLNNVISIPEDNSITDIITLNTQGSVSDAPEVTVETTVDGKDALQCDVQNDGESISSFLTDGIVSLSDLQPSTSQNTPAYNSDFHDDFLSESLQTPKVTAIDEDPYISTRRDSKSKGKEKTKGQNNYNNYQLATTDSTSLAKNVLSNHLLSVDEKLNFTQDRLASTWNLDVQKLLGLFSTDELASYDAFSNNFTDDIQIKTEPCDVTGNELVQFCPNMLDGDLANTPLFDALNEEPEVLNDDLTYHPLLSDVLNETDNSDGLNILPNDKTNTSSIKRPKPTSNSGKITESMLNDKLQNGNATAVYQLTAEDTKRKMFEELADVYKILSRHVTLNFTSTVKSPSGNSNGVSENKRLIRSSPISSYEQKEMTFPSTFKEAVHQTQSYNFRKNNNDAFSPNVLSPNNLSFKAKNVRSSLNELPKKEKCSILGRNVTEKLCRRLRKKYWKRYQTKRYNSLSKAFEKTTFATTKKDKYSSRQASMSFNGLHKGKNAHTKIKSVRTYITNANLKGKDVLGKTNSWKDLNKHAIIEDQKSKKRAENTARKSKYSEHNRNISTATTVYSSKKESKKSTSKIKSEKAGDYRPFRLTNQIQNKFKGLVKRNNHSSLITTKTIARTLVTEGKRNTRDKNDTNFNEPSKDINLNSKSFSRQFINYMQSNYLVVISFLTMCFLILSVLVVIVFLFAKSRAEFLGNKIKAFNASPNMVRKFDLPARPEEFNCYGSDKRTNFKTKIFHEEYFEGTHSLLSIGDESECCTEDEIDLCGFDIKHLSKPISSKCANITNKALRENDPQSKNSKISPSEKLFQLHKTFLKKESMLSSSTLQTSGKSSSIEKINETELNQIKPISGTKNSLNSRLHSVELDVSNSSDSKDCSVKRTKNESPVRGQTLDDNTAIKVNLKNEISENEFLNYFFQPLDKYSSDESDIDSTNFSAK
ncbi:hypothetical protein JTE90_014355 [Oedothorax gibbosus]|uniref:HSF-type DNA-binding domain-containing protein n=1 Tax=Oedothorax gibbosus TaxID=931172 RepID=A0AAV6UE97_9ARAC|nr:hypothetical protein JTE90_014355 [Oedothorax gibbosus]